MLFGPLTLTGMTSVSDTGFSCTEGIYTFSNFQLFGDTVPTTVSNFSLSLGPATNAAAGVLGFGYTDLDTNGDDFLVTFQIMPGVGSIVLNSGATSVTETICSVATSPSTCPGVVLNKSPLSGNNTTMPTASSLVTIAGTDFVVDDITGGSNITNNIVPEPVTFSLMGLGLLAIGLAGRKRLRKD
jgi:hypothetical protein